MLDELGAGLSGQEAKRLREAIQEVPGRFDAMVVLIDHDVELIRAVCQETIVQDFGQKIAEGATASVLSNETVRAAHLGEDFLA